MHRDMPAIVPHGVGSPTPDQSGTRPVVRRESPGSRTRTVCTCQGLRPRGTGDALALTRTPVLPSAVTKASASRLIISRLNGWPMHSPADASPSASRPKAHGSGPVRIATPSLQWTCTTYSLPVSRRTVTVITELNPQENVWLFMRDNWRQSGFSNPSTKSSITAATLGTRSSISAGGSCPSECGNGPTGSNR